jgi:hypothetical protein
VLIRGTYKTPTQVGSNDRNQLIQRWTTDWTAGVRFLAGAKYFYLRHKVQTVSGAHQAPYPVSTAVFFPSVKRPGREVENSHLLPRSRIVELGLQSPIPSLRKK